jgi:hypothetical protein
MRGFPIASFVVAASVIAAALVVPACSSPSNDAPDEAGITDVLFPQTCATPIRIGAGNPSTNTYSGGACGSSLAQLTCTFQAPESCAQDDITIYTCTCDGTSWSCTITGDVEGGSCDAASVADADVNEPPDADDDAATNDASDD